MLTSYEIDSLTVTLNVFLISGFETDSIKIAAEPAFFAVITPVDSTKTILSSLEVYVKFLLEAFDGRTVVSIV